MANTPLTSKERARYECCKKQIQEGLRVSFDTGCALIEVRDSKLYREDYDTFEQFCSTQYQISRGQAYRLIEAAEVQQSLPKNLAKEITNEAQARALSDVPEEDRAKVITDLKKSGEPITATAIQTAAQESKMSPIGDKNRAVKTGKSENSNVKQPEPKKEKKPVIELDETGIPIPADALPFWARRDEAQKLLTDISRIKCIIEKAKADGDPLYGKVSNGVIMDLTKAYSMLQEAKPYAVCTTCMGSFSVQPKGCSFCGNKGLISKWQWDTQARKEIKDIRAKMVARA